MSYFNEYDKNDNGYMNEIENELILNKIIRKIMNNEYYNNYKRKWIDKLTTDYDNLDYINVLHNKITNKRILSK